MYITCENSFYCLLINIWCWKGAAVLKNCFTFDGCVCSLQSSVSQKMRLVKIYKKAWFINFIRHVNLNFTSIGIIFTLDNLNLVQERKCLEKATIECLFKDIFDMNLARLWHEFGIVRKLYSSSSKYSFFKNLLMKILKCLLEMQQ